jgi:hypothetical protein
MPNCSAGIQTCSTMVNRISANGEVVDCAVSICINDNLILSLL